MNASGTCLPGIKPFRPPTEDVTQVLLLSNRERVEHIEIVCIVSYFLGNDPDKIKESITVKI